MLNRCQHRKAERDSCDNLIARFMFTEPNPARRFHTDRVQHMLSKVRRIVEPNPPGGKHAVKSLGKNGRPRREEIGILKEVMISNVQPADRCFLRVEHKGSTYVGCLLIEFRPSALK